MEAEPIFAEHRKAMFSPLLGGALEWGLALAGCDQRSLVTLIPQLELVAALDAIAKTRPTSGSLVRPAGLTWG